MNLHKMIEICLKDDNMHTFIMINALICINNYVITCINSMLSRREKGEERMRRKKKVREKTYERLKIPVLHDNMSLMQSF